MERETRVSYAAVPHSLNETELAQASYQIDGDRFLLRGEGHHYFHYRKGEGITVERGPGADISEEGLWLNGSVYAAIASLNGLLPIHASAVAADGQVFAFTGPAGAGKSTLIAALGARGLPMFCDDTLVLDLSDPQQVMCLPGHKRLKLRSDAITLTGAKQCEPVARAIPKFYCEPPAGEISTALPLGQLILLEEASDARITPITGFERYAVMQDDHYTAALYAGAQRLDAAGRFAHFSQLANRITLARFSRPRDAARFAEGVDLVRRYVDEAVAR